MRQITRFRYFFLTVVLLSASACNFLKFNPTDNCLNPSASCFVQDTGRPTVMDARAYASEADITAGTSAAINSNINALYAMDITFSEVLRGMTSTAAYIPEGSGAAALVVTSAQKLTKTSVRLIFSGAVNNGPIAIRLQLTDLANNAILDDANHPVPFTGNIGLGASIAIQTSTHLSTLTAAGTEFNSINLQWFHTYSDDPNHHNNWWLVHSTTAPTESVCNFPIPSGSTFQGNLGTLSWDSDGINGGESGLDLPPDDPLTPGVQNAVNLTIMANRLTQGLNYITICLQNYDLDGGYFKQGFTVIPLVRDDLPPTVAASPGGGAYRTAQSVTLSCQNNADRVIYTTNGSTPTWNGTTANGTVYNGAWQTPGGSGAVTTTLKFLCVDRAGNQSPVITETYTVDGSLPGLTVNVPASVLSNQSGARNSVSIGFTSTATGTYKVYDSAIFDCTSPGHLYTGTGNHSFTVNANDLPVPSAGDISQASYTICVFNNSGTASSRQTITLYRDDTPPLFNGLASLNIMASSAFLSWGAAVDATAVEYRICRATTAGACAASAFDPAAPEPGVNITVTYSLSATSANLNPANKYYYGVRAFDAAGNHDGNTILEKVWGVARIVISSVAGNGSSLRVLKNEEPETIAIGTNGNYTAAASYLPGDNYSISILASPANHLCSLGRRQFGTVSDGADIEMEYHCLPGLSDGTSYRTQVHQPMPPFQWRTRVTAHNLSLAMPGALHFNQADQKYYIADQRTIRRCEADLSGCVIIAGSTAAAGLIDGIGTAARFTEARALASDGKNLYITDSANHAVRKLNLTTLRVETLAGNGNAGWGDGQGSDVRFYLPDGLVLRGETLLIADSANNRIRQLNLATGNVSTLSGAEIGYVNGSLNAARYNAPAGLALHGDQLYVAEINGNRLRRIDLLAEQVSLLAGDTASLNGQSGSADGVGAFARFSGPAGLATDGMNLYISDSANGRLRVLNLQTQETRTLAGIGATSAQSGTGIAARMGMPRHLQLSNGHLHATQNSGSGRAYKLVEAGLIGYWPLGGSDAQNYGRDIPPQADLTQAGSLPTDLGRYAENNGATVFNGSSYAHGDFIASTPPYTVSAWVFWNGPGSGIQTIFSLGCKQGSCAPESGFSLMIAEDGQLYSARWGYNHDYASYRIPADQWVHVSAHVSDRILFYVNGKPVETATTFNSISMQTNSRVTLGATYEGSSYTQIFKGKMTDIRLYNYLLTESELNELAQQASPVLVGASYSDEPTGLLSHFRFSPAATNSGPLDNLSFLGSNTATGYDFTALSARYYNGSSHDEGPASGLPEGNSPLTVCSWVRPFIYPSSGLGHTIVQYGSGQPVSLRLWNNSGTQQLLMAIGGQAVQTNVPLPLYTWSHVCASYQNDYSGSTGLMRLYLDGGEIANIATGHVNMTTFNTTLRIGRNLDNTSGFIGEIDELRIYNRALTAHAIRRLAQVHRRGLIAAYDLDGSMQDTSGFGNHAGGSVSTEIDRFGRSNRAGSFSGTQHLTATVKNLPVNNEPRTLCAWVKQPAGSFNYHVIAGYGSGAGRRFVVYADGILYALRHGEALNNFFDPIVLRTRGVWDHICVSYASSTTRFYYNGWEHVLTYTANMETPATDQFYIGRDIFTANYFQGQLDDVQIYNRALSVNEIRALVRQPNKRLQLTATTYSGNLKTLSPGNAIEGADLQCPVGYKTFIMDGNNSLRDPCSNISDCAFGVSAQRDWVLKSNQTYVRSDGITPVMTASFKALIETNLINPIDGGAGVTFWTGRTANWISFSNDDNCNRWEQNSGNGITGNSSATNLNDALGNLPLACNQPQHLLCVEQ